jgi:hypothetical protein
MLADIDLRSRKETGISFQQTDDIDERGVNIATELDVIQSSSLYLISLLGNNYYSLM